VADSEFRAVLAAEPDGPAGRLADLRVEDLPEGDLLVRVTCSSLNYKDGLAVTGRAPVVRRFPMVCGVDLAGEVLESGSDVFAAGDTVVVTGFGLGEEHWGGFAGMARVRSEWAVRLPAGMTALQAMACGTAGLTAMLCVLALERHGLEPGGDLPVLVTGAAGGVGSVAVALLAEAGFDVAASSGRPEQESYLRGLGATSIVPREELASAPPKALEREQYAGVVDAVGGAVLATALRRTRYGGTVAACGLAGGGDLPTTVHPFILRGVTLAGVESVRCPLALREQAWGRLAGGLRAGQLDAMTTVEPLDRVPELAEEILAGRTRGRVVVEPGR
jgi:acrylyl-CoA reductase (NADPH)